MMCEKCWADAYDGGYFGGCESQTERYSELLKEREDSPCYSVQSGKIRNLIAVELSKSYQILNEFNERNLS